MTKNLEVIRLESLIISMEQDKRLLTEEIGKGNHQETNQRLKHQIMKDIERTRKELRSLKTD